MLLLNLFKLFNINLKYFKKKFKCFEEYTLAFKITDKDKDFDHFFRHRFHRRPLHTALSHQEDVSTHLVFFSLLEHLFRDSLEVFISQFNDFLFASKKIDNFQKLLWIFPFIRALQTRESVIINDFLV